MQALPRRTRLRACCVSPTVRTRCTGIRSRRSSCRSTTSRDGSGAVKTLLIVFHSMTGAARQMAEAAAEGAADQGVHVRLVRAAECTAAEVLAADAYVFATPEN